MLVNRFWCPPTQITSPRIKAASFSAAGLRRPASHRIMSKEYLWVGKLSKNAKEITFNPQGGGDHDTAIGHSLLLKKVLLGPCADTLEMNVVEMETTGYMGYDIKAPLCILQPTQEKKFDQCQVDILVSQGEAKFKLVQGSGPITIYGQHLIEYVEEDLGSDDLSDLEDEEEEEMNSTKVEAAKSLKRKRNKELGLLKKVAKVEPSPKGYKGQMDDEDIDEDEEEEDLDDEEEEEEEEESPEKPKKKPGAFVRKVPGKNVMQGVAKEGKAQKKMKKDKMK